MIVILSLSLMSVAPPAHADSRKEATKAYSAYADDGARSPIQKVAIWSKSYFSMRESFVEIDQDKWTPSRDASSLSSNSSKGRGLISFYREKIKPL
jgi:hypothetical protein